MAILAPVFWEMSKRCENADALWQWIGGLVVPDSPRKQVLLLWGDGDGGKSAFVDTIKLSMGTAAVTLNAKSFDRFWAARLVGKRLTVVSEKPVADLMDDDIFKAVTGDECVPVRFMRQMEFDVRMDTKIVCVSNPGPDIRDDVSLRNRIIPCEVRPVPEASRRPRAEVMRDLRRELPLIMGFCRDRYLEKRRPDGSIAYEEEKHLRPHMDETETEFLDLFEANFVVTGKDSDMVLTDHFTARLRMLGLYEDPQRKAFASFVRRRFKTVRSPSAGPTVRDPETKDVTRAWRGMVLKR